MQVQSWVAVFMLSVVGQSSLIAQETRESRPPSEPSAAAGGGPKRPIDPARRTPTVRLIERCLPAVVSIRAFGPASKGGNERVIHGSASIVHPAGYLLTNAHVVGGMMHGEAVLASGKVHVMRVLASFPHEDIAIAKIDVDELLPTLAIGRSDDLLLGEPALSIGSPAGLSTAVAEGIVSGLTQSTPTENLFVPTMIETSAAASGGSSGGPLINAVGEQIGVITSRKSETENIGYAITIDRVREALPAMLAAEQRQNFQLGISVDMLAPLARVTAVVHPSPAEAAGVQSGDVIKSIDGTPIRQGIDFHLNLFDRHPGQSLTLGIDRDGQELSPSLTLSTLPLARPASDEGLVAGLTYNAYQGHWTRLPDFTRLKPVGGGLAEKPSANVFKRKPDDFGLVFTGLVRIPSEGLYTFYIRSDDGSRLTIDDQTVVDNDGLHAVREASGLVRLAAGAHPLRVEFFESYGGEVLEVLYEGPNVIKQPVPAGAFFHRAAQP